MQENQKNKSGGKRKGVASLFDDYEIKDLFKRFIQLLVVVEVLIFLVCWVYQLGIDEVAVTGKPVDVPFPWKAYFLVSFAAPVALTFLTGIVVVAFNSFLYGQRGQAIFKEDGLEGFAAKVAKTANFCFQLPFLLTLLLLGALIGVVYNMGAIMDFLARFGEAASKFSSAWVAFSRRAPSSGSCAWCSTTSCARRTWNTTTRERSWTAWASPSSTSGQ